MTLVAGAQLDRLDEDGFALVTSFLDRAACEELRDTYGDASLFRSRIVMERHAYGRGEYQYFANPLPARVAALREGLYAALVPHANRWMERLGSNVRYPANLAAFLHECFEGEQVRPTALLLRYGPGDFNCLHQDVYGPVAFPLQATVYLSRPGEEFAGGEVVLTESRARAQTRAHVFAPQQGDLLVLPNRVAPRRSASGGAYRATFRHGVATVTRGTRYTLGLIFHDAL